MTTDSHDKQEEATLLKQIATAIKARDARTLESLLPEVEKINAAVETGQDGPERVWITWDDAYPWDTPEMGGDEYVRAEVVNRAATRMRKACVAKLDSVAKHGSNELVSAALGMAARSLESITLDGEKEQ